ncbi:uncharacterized protein LOC108091151 [Drosophila ficusphila]|uniref:uncharacterized protein LOC108091151 n=1 Tax=Drosophila ficusphila TaxID=30025 RepID=UPI0007E6BE64|nr:uncharacterized protein LOC108091151 [Drosophila ficusphila]
MESVNRAIYVFLLISLIIVESPAAIPNRRSYIFDRQFCMDTVTGRPMYLGEFFTREGQCVRVQCLESQQLWEDSCNVPNLTTGDCKPVESDLASPEYPRCCPLYECKTHQKNEGGTMEMTNTYDHYGNLLRSRITEMIVVGQVSQPKEDIPSAPARKYQV